MSLLRHLYVLPPLAILAALGCNGGGGGGGGGNAGPPPFPVPAPPSDAVFQLGQALFHDKILSGNKNVACSTCHSAGTNGTDGLSLSIGQGGAGIGAVRTSGTGVMLGRNAPTLFGTAAFGYGDPSNGGTTPGGTTPGGTAPVVSISTSTFFWDSRVTVNPMSTPDPKLTDTTPDPQYQAIVTVLQTASPQATQAMFPVLSPQEMRGNPGENEIASAPDNLTAWQLLMARLVGTNNGTQGGIQAYRDLFTQAFPGVPLDQLNFAHAATAISTFVSLAFSQAPTPFDEFQEGNTAALTPSQQNGMALFNGKARCATCHAGDSFSDFKPHGTAVTQVGPGMGGEPSNDRGIALTTGVAADSYKFRTPSLRNVAVTGPWMHDGAYTTLEGAVRQMLDPTKALASYDSSQLRTDVAATVDTDPSRNSARLAALDPVLATPVTLTDGEVNDLVSFLGSLTDTNGIQNAQANKPASVPSGLPVD